MSFTYNRDTPDGPHNPSVDQPLMKINTNSTDDILSVDHFSFASNKAGKHQKVTLVQTPSPTNVVGEIDLYNKVGTGGSSQLWMNRDGFGALVDVPLTSLKIITPVAAANGKTWFAGDLIFLWNFVPFTSTGIATITFGGFPVLFPNNCFSVVTNFVSSADAIMVPSNIVVFDVTNLGLKQKFR